MSRIAVVAPVPAAGTVGGAERLWSALVDDLTARGHVVDFVTEPVSEATSAEVLDAYSHFAGLDLGSHDLVISGKYPAWMVDHPRHLVYLLHPLRGLYDTYPSSLPVELPVDIATQLASFIGGSPRDLLDWARDLLVTHPELDNHPGPFGRAVVRALDRMAFQRVARFGAISETVAQRVDYLPHDQPILVAHPRSAVATKALERPLVQPEGPTVFFTASRLDDPKRIDLLIAAFDEYRDPHARLRIAGDGPAGTALRQAARGDRRVEFLGRPSDDELIDEYRQATAVVFCPADEDYGYITAEAMAAGTPVITTVDSGGPCELVEHGINGLAVEADPRRLAWGMAHIADSPHVRWSMGLNARRRAAAISWQHLLDEADRLLDDRDRPKAVTLSTYPIEPVVGGGSRRMRHLHRRLARSADVTVLVSSAAPELAAGGRTRRRLLEPGLTQVEVPRSDAQRQAEEDIYAVMGFPVDDLTVASLAPATPEWGAELGSQVDDADIVITTQPFLAPTLSAIEASRPGRWTEIHDSQNHEAVFKASALTGEGMKHSRRRRAGAEWLADQARWAETIAVQRADLITACTDDDLAALQAMATRKAGVMVPNGVDTAALPRRTPDQQARARRELLGLVGLEPDDERPLAIFVGSWHPPNIAAGRLVLDMARRRSDWVFLLAGSHTSEFAEDDTLQLPPNVGLLAVFDEGLLWPLIAGASVAVNPMTSGGGSNLKLFDYLSVGTPVLTTPIGARGLDNADRYVRVCPPTVDALVSGLDTILDDPMTGDRCDAGRDLVEAVFDWEVLGTDWAEAILAASGHSALEPTTATAHSDPVPVLADQPPPPLDPTLAAIRAIGRAARSQPPTPEETAMDPVVRERLKQASDNRHVGRELPDTARLRLPKQALIRMGQIISNEQLNYNEAMLDVVNRLAVTVEELTETVRRLEDRLDTADREEPSDPESEAS